MSWGGQHVARRPAARTTSSRPNAQSTDVQALFLSAEYSRARGRAAARHEGFGVPVRSIPGWYHHGMTTQMTVRLSDESATFIDELVASGATTSRAAALDKLVRREMRRVRAMQDALIYAHSGEDPELAGFHEAARVGLRGQDLDQ